MRSAVLLAGCLGPYAPSPTKDPANCAPPAIPSEGAYAVHAQIANEMDHAACIQLIIDGVVIGAKWLDAEQPALHANPAEAGGGRVGATSALVRLVEEGTDHAYEERVILGEETWVVGWLDDNGGNIETYDDAPTWM